MQQALVTEKNLPYPQSTGLHLPVIESKRKAVLTQDMQLPSERAVKHSSGKHIKLYSWVPAAQTTVEAA